MHFQHLDSDNFGGLINAELPLSEIDVIIQGIPYESATSGKKGTSFAPDVLRTISRDMQPMSRRGINLSPLTIRDVGDVLLHPLDGAATRENIEYAFSSLTSKSSATIISLGGDHSVSYPMIKALASQTEVGIIWFDAHRDLLDEYLNSKYSHGSPLRRVIELDTIDPRNVFLVGTRYMTTEEQDVVETQGIKELSAVAIEESTNVRELFKKSVKDIAQNVDKLYVSIDIDVLDPAFAPGTGTPVPGGLSTSQLMNFLWDIPVKIRAYDLVEISPHLDPLGITVKAAVSLLAEILAKIQTIK